MAQGGQGKPDFFPLGIVLPKTTGVGLQVDTVNPTFGWKDLLGVIQTRQSGGTVPAFSAYIGNIWQYSFGTGAGVVEIFNEYHMPHDFLPNSDMFVHSHWSTIVAPTGDINWLFEVSYAKGYDQMNFITPVVIPVTQTSTQAFRHMIAETQLSATGGVIASAINVSITSGSATLTAASALFTAGDIGRTVRITGAGVAGADLDTTISAFTSTTQVTLANTALTTVTTLPNYKARVLDSSLLEIDGIILVRTWRDASRTADTLNVAPFVHYVDCHYQSAQIATKNKNYPFYS